MIVAPQPVGCTCSGLVAFAILAQVCTARRSRPVGSIVLRGSVTGRSFDDISTAMSASTHARAVCERGTTGGAGARLVIARPLWTSNCGGQVQLRIRGVGGWGGASKLVHVAIPKIFGSSVVRAPVGTALILSPATATTHDKASPSRHHFSRAPSFHRPPTPRDRISIQHVRLSWYVAPCLRRETN